MPRAIAAVAVAVLFAGCASAPPPAPVAEQEVPEVLEGVPASVIAGRALFDLDRGDPLMEARARCVLLAMADGPGLEALRARAKSAAPGSDARFDALAILAERGDPLGGVAPSEAVAMSVREISRREASSRGALLALDRLRRMGGAALPELRAEAGSPGPRAATAAAVLTLLTGEVVDRRLRETRP